MGPKEKAKELWTKYANCPIITEGKHATYKGLTTSHAVEISLITVDEILTVLDAFFDEDFAEVIFWREVKKELSKL
jgi:hypothetical protein